MSRRQRADETNEECPYILEKTNDTPLPVCPWQNPAFDPTAVNIHTLRLVKSQFDTTLSSMIACQCISCQGFLKHAWRAAHAPAASSPVLQWFSQQPSGQQKGLYPWEVRQQMAHASDRRRGLTDADRYYDNSVTQFAPAVHRTQSGRPLPQPLSFDWRDTRTGMHLDYSLRNKAPYALDLGEPASAPVKKTHASKWAPPPEFDWPLNRVQVDPIPHATPMMFNESNFQRLEPQLQYDQCAQQLRAIEDTLSSPHARLTPQDERNLQRQISELNATMHYLDQKLHPL